MNQSSLAAAGWTDVVGAVGGVAAALAAAGALFYAGRQYSAGQLASKRQLTYEYSARFSAPEMIPYYAKWAAFIGLGNSADANVPWSSDDPAERLEEFHAGHLQERLEILVAPNFLEEVAGMYNRDLLDREIVSEVLGEVVTTWWTLGSWFIEPERARNPKHLRQWKAMRDDMVS